MTLNKYVMSFVFPKHGRELPSPLIHLQTQRNKLFLAVLKNMNAINLNINIIASKHYIAIFVYFSITRGETLPRVRRCSTFFLNGVTFLRA